jgi:5-methylcytosine-specific restriction endonuclease McrA
MITEASFKQAISHTSSDWDLVKLLAALRDDSPLKEEIQNFVTKAVFLRCLFLMLPDIDDHSSYNVRKKIVTNFLKIHFNTVSDESVDFVVELTAKLSAAKRGFRKDSWTDLHYSTKNLILENQGGRCRVCGQVLDLSGNSKLLNAPELDHVIPFGLGGNSPSNLVVICKRCNLTKSDDISVITADALDINYFLKDRKKGYRKRLMYWVNIRDGCACTNPRCTNSSKNARLYVEKITPSGRTVYDNMRTVCEHCAIQI